MGMIKIRIFVISLFFIILVRSVPHNLGKDLTKINMKDKDNSYSKAQRNLKNDNYIVLYFNQDCYYSSGFVNDYRKDIDYIINAKINYKEYTKKDPLSVYKGFGIEIHFNKAISSLEYFFYSYDDKNMKYLVFVDFTNFNSNSVTNMLNMFDGCSSLKSINFSNFKTSKVTKMSYVFHECSSLESIDLSNFDTSQVTYMNLVFCGCSLLKFIDLSNFITSKAIHMNYFFYGCTSLESIDLSNFDTSQVTEV